MLETLNLCKSFDGRSVLENVSLTLSPGDRVCVTGPSGRGKTTLLRVLCGLEEPDSGTVACPPGTRFGVVFQEDRLLEAMTAEDNVALVSRRSREEIRCTLRAFLLSEEDLSRPVSAFSGGMKRRVALCRALLSDADILLLDEPYKGLDEDTRAAVMRETERLAGSRAVLLISHDEREAPGFRLFPLKTV